MSANPDPLYKALDAYEDAANAVGVQTITTQGAYSQLAAAIGGHGDLQEARARFALEVPILAAMHTDWLTAANALYVQIADALAWQDNHVNGELHVLDTADLVRDCD